MNTYNGTGSTPPDTSEQPGLTRRRMLGSAGLLGLALVGGNALGAGQAFASSGSADELATALALTPEAEEGPFYVGIEKIRRNVRMGRPGIPLKLRIKVVDATTGQPIPSAALDIWQCDASGAYSDESSAGTVGSTWLRGVQLTESTGLAEFDSIYPGHYEGRDTHVHVKVHIGGVGSGPTYSGGHVSHTGQLFFSDAISDQVYKLAPYTSDTAARVTHANDHVYTEQGGSKTQLVLRKLGASVSDGFRGTITLKVDPSSTPAGVGVSNPGG